MYGDYRITEPHPTPATQVVFSGRGGFGNTTRKSKSSLTHGPTASGPPSLTRLSSSTSTVSNSSTSSSSSRKTNYYLSGRGGAGNALPSKERAIFSFDEELAAQSRMMESAAPVYHVGRGGSGNAVRQGNCFGGTSAGSGASSTASSASAWSVSEEKEKEKAKASAWSRVSKPFSR